MTLRKQWKKANEEKEGLKALWEEAKKTLAGLQGTERIRKRRTRKKERSSFLINPFKHARQEKREAENHTIGAGESHQ